MTVTMDQVKRGTQAYYETEFCQKATGMDKFAAYFMLPSVPSIVQSKLEQFKSTPLAAGLFNSDGLVDIDAVRERALTAMEHCGNVEVMGFRLGAADIDKLYDNIRRA